MFPASFALLLVASLTATAAAVPPAAPAPLQAPPACRTEELAIQVANFAMVGDLIIPGQGGRHPVLIVVPGDGPFTRADGLGLLKTLGLFDYLMDAGYALFIDDKPGCGASQGEFSAHNLLHERAAILSGWIARLKHHPAVDSRLIGLAGASQAGYVMPLALATNPDLAFLIALSCPAVDSATQSAYLVEQQLLCDGVPVAEARRFREAYLQRAKARSYPEYRQAAELLAANPTLKALGWGDILTEPQFEASAPGSETCFDPVSVLEQTTVPVLALFGAKDTQADPVQGAGAYRRALEAAGNPFFQVMTIPNADHILSVAETGCLKEIEEKFRTGNVTFAPEYPAAIREWMGRLTPHLRDRNRTHR